MEGGREKGGGRWREVPPLSRATTVGSTLRMIIKLVFAAFPQRMQKSVVFKATEIGWFLFWICVLEVHRLIAIEVCVYSTNQTLSSSR